MKASGWLGAGLVLMLSLPVHALETMNDSELAAEVGGTPPRNQDPQQALALLQQIASKSPLSVSLPNNIGTLKMPTENLNNLINAEKNLVLSAALMAIFPPAILFTMGQCKGQGCADLPNLSRMLGQ